MASRISLAAQQRDADTTPRALRRAEMVPAVIYGRGFEPRSLQVPYLQVAQVVRLAGANRLVELGIEGDDHAETVLIREVQRDPVSSRVLHVDFYRIVAGQRITSSVPLVAEGQAPVLLEGGLVTQVLNALEVECLPRDIPPWVPVDVSNLVHMHSRLTVADLVVPENVTVLTPANAEVARATMPRKVEEAEEVELAEFEIAPEAEGEAVEGEKGEETPSGVSSEP